MKSKRHHFVYVDVNLNSKSKLNRIRKEAGKHIHTDKLS